MPTVVSYVLRFPFQILLWILLNVIKLFKAHVGHTILKLLTKCTPSGINETDCNLQLHFNQYPGIIVFLAFRKSTKISQQKR